MFNEIIGDLVVYGKTYTAEKTNEVCEAFVVKDKKIIYVGDKETASKYIKEGLTKVIDNGDGLIIPSCTEAHAHFIGVDAMVKILPGFYASYEEIIEIIKKDVETFKQRGFFLSFGFNYIELTERLGFDKNYAQELEDLLPQVPVVLLDNGGHQAICNITALKRAGVYDERKNIRGGEILYTKDDIPSGIVTDEVVLYVLERAIDFSKVDPEIYRLACKNAINTLHERGFTNFYDAYINYLAGVEFYKYIKELDDKDELNINATTTYCIRSYEANEYKQKIDYLRQTGDKYATKHFNPYHMKMFADGVVETKTGWMIEEYPNPIPGREHGNIIWKEDELKDLVTYANSKGSPVHIHTYGDGACKAVIDAYIYARQNCTNKIHNTLAHVRNIRKEDILRCAENDIGIAENLIWHTDVILDENYEEDSYAIKSRYQDGVYESGYPMKSLVEAGISVTSSTDAPAAESILGNIMNIIEVATTGLAPGYNGYHVFNKDELLTVRQALDCLTINGAYQLGISDRTGSIKVGKSADFVMLDIDFLDYEGEDLRKIHNAKINSLYFEGKEVFKS